MGVLPPLPHNTPFSFREGKVKVWDFDGSWHFVKRAGLQGQDESFADLKVALASVPKLSH
jgi:hypothetical protein